MTEEPEYQIDFFRSDDAKGIVNLYHAVYGDNYPVRSVYDAEEIIRQENANETYRMVARSLEGEVIGHIAVYRSIPPAPNPSLYEVGQLMVHPDHRQSSVAFELMHECSERIPREHHIDIWGEAVTNHLFSQQMAAREGYVETGLEMDLMPESSYDLPSSQRAGGRVSSILVFMISTPRSRNNYVPRAYADLFKFIYEGIKGDHAFTIADSGMPPGSLTTGSMVAFKEAGVVRITLTDIGSDLPAWIEKHEKEAAEGLSPVLTQVILPLSVPWIGAAVDILRKEGYFIGGALPGWYVDDGILLQKHNGVPNFDGAHMYTKRAKRLKELVKADWTEVTGRA